MFKWASTIGVYMQIRWVIVIGFLCSLQSFAVEKIVKTYDGHRIICKTDAHVKEFLNQKAVQVLVAQDRQVLVQLVKCSHDGWVQDSNPTQACLKGFEK